MTSTILPFRRRPRAVVATVSSGLTPEQAERLLEEMWAPVIPASREAGGIPTSLTPISSEVIEMRDELVAGWLELRDQHLPRMSWADRRLMQILNDFLLYGGLGEDSASLEHNLGLTRELLAVYRERRRPVLVAPSRLKRAVEWLHVWLTKVEAP